MSEIEERSKFQRISTGRVAEDKPLESRYIQVFLQEQLPLYEGVVGAETLVTVRDGVDADGKKYSVTVEAGITVKAGWLPSTSRRTSPNVRKGERVHVYTTLGSEEYYWDSMGMDDDLRRGEKVEYSWNASGHGPEKDIKINDTNSYSAVLDTINKALTLNTTDDNGEPFTYTLQLNTGEGVYTLVVDNKGNTIQLDSSKTKITLVNADGSFVEINKKDINIFAPGNINMEAGKDINITAGANYNRTVKKNSTTKVSGKESTDVKGGAGLKVGGSRSVKIRGSYSESSSKYTGKHMGGMSVKAAKVSFSSAMLSCSGVVSGPTGSFGTVGKCPCC